MQSVTSRVEFRDVAKGLWIWRAEHHHWKPGDDWQPVVTSTFVESGGERLVLDPLVPKTGAEELWKRLDARPPTLAAVLIPDHVRDVDEFVRRYKVRPFGPRLFWPDDVPKTALEILEPDRVLPGGLVALYDGRGRLETPVWLPEQRVIVFGDALTERGGKLLVHLSKLSFPTATMSRCIAARPMSVHWNSRPGRDSGPRDIRLYFGFPALSQST